MKRILGVYTNFKETKRGFEYSGVDLVRLVLPLKYLESKKYKVDLAFDLFEKYKTTQELVKHYDIIYFSYIHDPQVYIQLKVCALKTGTKIIMDIDDDIWDVDPTHPHYKNDYAPGSENMFNRTAILLDCDHIVTTSSFLKRKVVKHVGKKHEEITVIPNFIDLTMYDYKKIPKVKSNEITIGWMGGSSHFRDITHPDLLNALKKLMNKYPEVRFKTTAYYPQLKALFGYKYKYCLARNSVLRFIEEVWTEMASECQIMIAPLMRNDYSRSKSYVKLLEYGAAQLPVVAQRIDPYQDFCGVIPEEKGVFLADSTEEWYNYLEKLILSESLRKNMGLLLYNEVKKNHTIQENKNNYDRLFDKITK
jgi:glycosyltransferase involved in cell wall biosynthesis